MLIRESGSFFYAGHEKHFLLIGGFLLRQQETEAYHREMERIDVNPADRDLGSAGDDGVQIAG